MKNITAYSIQKLLKQKHSSDVYVSECKTRPSEGVSHLRLDGLAIKRSWSNPAVTGYEIKISRSDFLNDEKYHNYKDYCNFFYFVCPPNLIKPEEIKDDTGLLWVSTTGTRLFKKKKALYRDVDIPADIYKYILISRAMIEDKEYPVFGYKKRYWEKWLEKKEIDRDFGHYVSKTIREEINKKIFNVEYENQKLKDCMQNYDTVIKLLKEWNIDPDRGWNLKFAVKDKLEELKRGLPKDFNKVVEETLKGLNYIDSIINTGE